MCHNLFILSPTEGHLGGFQVLAIMHKTAIGIHVQILSGYMFLIHLCKYQGIQQPQDKFSCPSSPGPRPLPMSHCQRLL